MKVDYVQCDICGNKILDNVSGHLFRHGIRLFADRKNGTLDVCDSCRDKIKMIKTDIILEEELANKILDGENFKKYSEEDSGLASVYLDGVQDVIVELLVQYRIRKGDKNG